MSEASLPCHALYLILEGLSPERLEELKQLPEDPKIIREILPLTETNSREALGKIFAADTVTVWGALLGESPRS